MHIKLARRLLLVISALLPGALLHAEPLAVIVHPANHNPALTDVQVARIFLGKITIFPDESPATPVTIRDDEALRAEFELKVLGKNPVQLRAYWARQLFTGRGGPPESFPNWDALKKHVANTPGAVGFIPERQLDGSVRAVLLVK